MIGGTLNIKHVRAHWDEILRMATSIKSRARRRPR
nr:Tn3 family transposase [Klebsiella grimontii]